MSKKILVKESAFGKFLQSFFIAKARKRDNAWISKLEKQHPEVAKSWQELNKKIDSDIMKQRAYLKSKGFDTSALDDYIKSTETNI
jgi:hypothetical protein